MLFNQTFHDVAFILDKYSILLTVQNTQLMWLENTIYAMCGQICAKYAETKYVTKEPSIKSTKLLYSYL